MKTKYVNGYRIYSIVNDSGEIEYRIKNDLTNELVWESYSLTEAINWCKTAI